MQPAITVTTFYCFTPLADPQVHKPALLAGMKERGIRGTVTLAREGVNATISGQAEALSGFIEQLKSQLGITLPMMRESFTGAQPFKRSKVKVKRELISLGVEADPSMCVGRYVAPQDWNALITRDDVIAIDTRNDYEFALGPGRLKLIGLHSFEHSPVTTTAITSFLDLSRPVGSRWMVLMLPRVSTAPQATSCPRSA